MQNTCLFYTVSQVLKILLIKLQKIHDATSPFVSCCFTLAFICIGRYDFLQVFRTFLMDSPKPIHPPNSQNPPSVTKVFC